MTLQDFLVSLLAFFATNVRFCLANQITNAVPVAVSSSATAAAGS
jgi:hypothetical protein